MSLLDFTVGQKNESTVSTHFTLRPIPKGSQQFLDSLVPKIYLHPTRVSLFLNNSLCFIQVLNIDKESVKAQGIWTSLTQTNTIPEYLKAEMVAQTSQDIEID